MQTLLAIECSSHVSAVAYLANIGQPDVWVGEMSRENHKASEWLLPAIERVLARARADKTGVNIVAFGAGPGSFTGVRTACATAQALAYAWQAALMPVDCLEALAHASGLGRVDVALDARMNELYTAAFEQSASDGVRRLSATSLLACDAYRVRAGVPIIGSGASLVADCNAALTRSAEDRWALGVAGVAIARFLAGERTDPRYAEPIYVRNNVAQTEAQRASAALAGGRA